MSHRYEKKKQQNSVWPHYKHRISITSRSSHTSSLCYSYFTSLIKVVIVSYDSLEFTACPMAMRINDYLLPLCNKTAFRFIFEESMDKRPFFGIIELVHRFEKTTHITTIYIGHFFFGSHSDVRLANCKQVIRSYFLKVAGLTQSFNLLCEIKCSSFNSHSLGSFLYFQISLNIIWVFCNWTAGQWWVVNFVERNKSFMTDATSGYWIFFLFLLLKPKSSWDNKNSQ